MARGRRPRPFTRPEDWYLSHHYGRMDLADIARTMGRSQEDIVQRARALTPAVRNPNFDFKPVDDYYLRTRAGELPVDRIATDIGCSKEQAHRRLKKLGVNPVQARRAKKRAAENGENAG